MMKLLVIFLIFFSLALVTNAKQSADSQQQSQATPKIIMEISVSDLVFTYKVLKTIDLQGNEVDAYLEIEAGLEAVISNEELKKMTELDIITIDLSPQVCNNLKIFLSRVKIPSSEAKRFKKIVTNLDLAINKFLESQK